MMGMGCAVAALAFTLTGCYESQVPMKEKGDHFEPGLLGRWVEVRTAEDAADPLKGSGLTKIVFEPSSVEGEYAVRHMNSSGDVTHFRVYIVEVDNKPADTTSPEPKAQGKPFLNAQVTEGEPDMVGKYFFFHYGINGDQLELRMVSDKFIKQQFETPEELYNLIRENLENEKLCEDPVVFEKQD